MGKKKAQVLTIGQRIETVVEHLTDLGYVYLGDSEFRKGHSVESAVSAKPYSCYRIMSERINFKTVEEIYIWNPSGMILCKLVFDYDGLSEPMSYITIGKNQYKGEKAIRLIEKNIFTSSKDTKNNT